MQNSFFIRTVHPSRPTLQEPQQRISISIEPQKVQFFNYPSSKISINRIVLKNQSRFPKKFTIIQPSKAYFEVKCKDRQLSGRQTTQIFIAFNPQRERASIQDEFAIKIQGQQIQIHVPISCLYKLSSSSKYCSSKQLIPNKENQQKIQSLKEKEKLVLRPKRSILVRSRHLSIERFPMADAEVVVDIRIAVVAEFQEKFKRISEYVKQKYVKNQIYLGEQMLTPAKQNSIKEYVYKITQAELNRFYNEARQRHQVEFHEEGPVLQMLGSGGLSWDLARNKPELTFESGLKKIQQQIRKYVISLRFQKIQSSLRIYQDYRTREQNQKRKLRVQQYVDYLNFKLQSNSIFSDYELQFDKNSLKAVHLPITGDYCSSPYQFEIRQRIGFDNWVPMNTIREHAQQIYSLSETQLPPAFVHLPSQLPTKIQYFAESLPDIMEVINLAEEAVDYQKDSEDQFTINTHFLQLHSDQFSNFANFECPYIIGNEDITNIDQQRQWLALGPLNPRRYEWKTANL